MYEKARKKVLKLMELTARNEVMKNQHRWPLLCGGLLHRQCGQKIQYQSNER